MSKTNTFVVPGAPAELQAKINASRARWAGWQMMADEQKHSHSSMLEWIIIILIAIEIVLFFVK